MSDGIRALAAAAPPDAVYLEHARSDRSITFGALTTAVDAAAGALDATVGRVALDFDDPLEFASTHLAVIAAGRFSVPLDPQSPPADRDRAVASLHCDLVVTDRPDRWPDRPAMAVADLQNARTGGRRASSEGGVLMRTSGSTGTPKVVRLTEKQLLSTARAVADNLGLTATDRGFNPLPLFHINGQVVAVLASLVAQSALVLDRRFRRTGFWPLLGERDVTWVNAVPAILGILAKDRLEPPTRLRLVRSASAPLPAQTRERLQRDLGVSVVESYGMTEAGSQITAGDRDGSTPFGSVGHPAGAEVDVRDVGENGVGRIWIRGPGVITGYEDGRAAERFADGWLDTGDDGCFGEGGELYIAGRSDDQINRGGELIYPAEVEDVLRADDRVAEVAVVARPDETMGQVPVAFVIAREGAAPDALVADLTARAEEHLSRFKRPAEIVVVDDLPRAPTGKILRKQIVADAEPAQ